MGVSDRFIRVYNSDGGFDDIVIGAAGSALVSNGPNVAPSFHSAIGGQLPVGFSYTQPWEKTDLDRNSFYNFGIGNFTCEFERDAAVAANGANQAFGPASYTAQADIPWSRRV